MPASRARSSPLAQPLKTQKSKKAELNGESRNLRSPRQTGKVNLLRQETLTMPQQPSSEVVGGKSRNVKMEEKLSRDAREFHKPRDDVTPRGGLVHRVTVAHRVVIFGPPRGNPQISVELEVQKDLIACLDHYTKIFREVRAVFSKGTYLGPRKPEPSQYSGMLAFLKEGDPGKVSLPWSSQDRYSAWCEFDHESAISFVTWNGRDSFVAISRVVKDNSLFVPSLLLTLKNDQFLPDCELGELLVVTALEFRGTVTCNVVKPLQLNWQCFDQNGNCADWHTIRFGSSEIGPSNASQDEDQDLDILSDASVRVRKGIYPTVERNFSLTNVKTSLSNQALDNMEEIVEI